MKVGQMQLLRQQIAHELTASAKYDSKYLYYSLKTFNEYVFFSIFEYFIFSFILAHFYKTFNKFIPIVVTNKMNTLIQ